VFRRRAHRRRGRHEALQLRRGDRLQLVEEVIRSLLEVGTLARSNGHYRLMRPASEIHIPGSIQEVVLARIDRLDRGTKGTIALRRRIGAQA
jgi:hypothetical protein